MITNPLRYHLSIIVCQNVIGDELGEYDPLLGAYQLIGSSADAAGVLREPFALIPLGWLCLLGTLVTLIIYALIRHALIRQREHCARRRSGSAAYPISAPFER